MGLKRTKEQLLAHYATGDVHKFRQIDGWILGYKNANEGTLQATDNDGDCITSAETWELRHMPASLAVRIFIHEGTDHEDAVRLIKKMLGDLERDPELLNPRNLKIEASELERCILEDSGLDFWAFVPDKLGTEKEAETDE